MLDHRLADATGGDLCRQLKVSKDFAHIPVIIFSAYINPGEALPVDCDGYLYKPFDLEELFTEVFRLLPDPQEEPDRNEGHQLPAVGRD